MRAHDEQCPQISIAHLRDAAQPLLVAGEFCLGVLMPIVRMDHFTILTADTEMTVAFYRDLLGFTKGPRPAFSFPGASASCQSDRVYDGDSSELRASFP